MKSEAVAPSATAMMKLVESILGHPSIFLLGTDREPFRGGEYAIYAMESEEERYRICLRIPRYLGPHTHLELEKEASLRRRIDLANIAHFQPLIKFDSSVDNPISLPYMILGWADGRPLSWSHEIPAEKESRRRVLQAVASVSIDMLKVHDTGGSAWQWMASKLERKISRAKNGKLPRGTVQECEQQKAMLLDFWIPQLDDAPHVLVHGDLSTNNIIVDEQSKVHRDGSIIDLNWASLMPLQFAAEYPRFINHEPVYTASGYTWSRYNSAQTSEDRALCLDCIKMRAERDGGMALDYYHILSRDDESRRFWWCAASHRIDVHKARASSAWKPPS